MTTNTHRQLSGKVAIVTGGSQGIGASIAKHLVAAGASVVVNYSSNAKRAASVLDSISSAGGRAAILQADVSQSADVARLFSETEAIFGRPDILVNNAGVYDLARVDQITEEQFHRQFNVNVLGIILTTQAAVKHFGAKGGSIINVSSIVSTLSPAGSAVYNATKSAVDALTRTFAKELGPRRIRVNSINPGPMETEGTLAAGIDSAAYMDITPLGRMGMPHDIAPVVAFLASSDSEWVTGEALRVSGGLR